MVIDRHFEDKQMSVILILLGVTEVGFFRPHIEVLNLSYFRGICTIVMLVVPMKFFIRFVPRCTADAATPHAYRRQAPPPRPATLLLIVGRRHQSRWTGAWLLWGWRYHCESLIVVLKIMRCKCHGSTQQRHQILLPCVAQVLKEPTTDTCWCSYGCASGFQNPPGLHTLQILAFLTPY